MMIINTQAIVIKAIKHKEYDLILVLFTRKLGKVSVVAKGARKSKSSLLSCSQIFTYGNYTLRRRGDMYILSQGDVIKSFYNLAYNLDAFTYATHITAILNNNLLEHQKNDRIFKLYAHTLKYLSENEYSEELLSRIFELKFLDYIGMKPQISVCVTCGSKNFDNAMFNVFEGGVVCENCSKKYLENIKIDITTLRFMEYILSRDINNISNISVSKYVQYQLNNILKKYLLAYMDNINFRAIDMLNYIEGDE